MAVTASASRGTHAFTQPDTSGAPTGSSVDSKHPDYSLYVDKWTKMQDCYEGEDTIKEKTFEYLPATEGMIEDGAHSNANSAGRRRYNAYVNRAIFPDIVSEAVSGLIGVMHHKPPVIELPDSMRYYLERATLQGENLQFLLRRINEAQLVSGRCGILADMSEIPAQDILPYLAYYGAEDIINWDAGGREILSKEEDLNLVVLNESDYRRQGFVWRYINRYRVCILGDLHENEPVGDVTYSAAVFDYENDASPPTVNDVNFIRPVLKGVPLNLIPFTFINSMDTVPTPSPPPLLGLANLALAIYRGEADYRHALFMQGQDTLVIIAATSEDGEAYRVGDGASIELLPGSDAKYIGTNSQGLSEMRQALEADYIRASEKGSQLIKSVSRDRESGEALKIRVAAKTAALNRIALAGAFGLERELRLVAKWLGEDPEKVKVMPNLDFTNQTITGQELDFFMQAKEKGLPLSNRSIHRVMEERGLTEFDFDEEMVIIEAELPMPSEEKMELERREVEGDLENERKKIDAQRAAARQSNRQQQNQNSN